MGERTALCQDCGKQIEKVGARGVPPVRCPDCKTALARKRALESRGGEYLVGPWGQYDRPDEARFCRVCEQTLPITSFRVRDAQRGTYRNECHECFKAGQRARYHAAPEKHRETMRRSTYGLAPGEYDRMHAEQDGLCAICGEPETSFHSRTGKTKRLFVDHHHETGQVRELLCMRCNMGIGQFRDDPDLLRRAASYLNKHHAV